MHRMHFFQKILPAIVAVGALFSAAAASAEMNKPMVFAQAGSTGGTIGEQDKSASGGEVHVPTRVQRAPLAPKHHVATRVQRAPLAPKHHVAARERRAPGAREHHVSEARSSHCGKVAGAWSVIHVAGEARGIPSGIPFEATFDENGGAYSLFFTGKWVCANGIVILTLDGGVVARATISHDGNSSTITNNKGETYIATRK